MKLHNLKAPASHKKRKRVGRGQGSGTGEQSGRGHNGQKSRSGSKVKAWFEGGQMPLQRRIPKFGFTNPFRTEYQALNVQRISEFIEAGKLGETITISDLVDAGLADDKQRIKLLGSGEIDSKISIEVHACSGSAREKVESAGGSVNVIE
ncbi:50S ribosomal protein L15 [Rhodohalobacter sp. SW132]|uniref:50S ribosomal protein L15 n=1 Tax=Rhodohalobacter sp. SW132 TaxID=2293433 RepID=UPI000E2840C5|nr:50S ribosomal protein L15 [Rhodohalobacter sp. SW132]REL23963.1 50S ribosomal protein L15 [Rhodohalobacter sp. SW132]